MDLFSYVFHVFFTYLITEILILKCLKISISVIKKIFGIINGWSNRDWVGWEKIHKLTSGGGGGGGRLFGTQE